MQRVLQHPLGKRGDATDLLEILQGVTVSADWIRRSIKH